MCCRFTTAPPLRRTQRLGVDLQQLGLPARDALTEFLLADGIHFHAVRFSYRPHSYLGKTKKVGEEKVGSKSWRMAFLGLQTVIDVKKLHDDR